MATTHQVRSESHDAAVLRLAGEAQRRGVRIYRTPDGRHWATSISQPGDLYFVTAYSCTCKGFTHHPLYASRRVARARGLAARVAVDAADSRRRRSAVRPLRRPRLGLRRLARGRGPVRAPPMLP